MRTIIIGDIHGCYRELKELLEKAAFSESDDRLILLGDYIDKGRDSYRVVAYIRELEKRMGRSRLIALRGNHEQLMMDYLANPERKQQWEIKGAAETIRSFRRHKKSLQSVEEWMHSTRLYHDTENFTAVHAAVGPMDLEYTDIYTLLFDHSLTREGRYRGKLIINGHTHMEHAIYQDGYGKTVGLYDDGTVYNLPLSGSICIDTSCVYGGRLTAMITENRAFYLVGVRAQ